jgi:hypothetical protein
MAIYSIVSGSTRLHESWEQIERGDPRFGLRSRSAAWVISRC